MTSWGSKMCFGIHTANKGNEYLITFKLFKLELFIINCDLCSFYNQHSFNSHSITKLFVCWLCIRAGLVFHFSVLSFVGNCLAFLVPWGRRKFQRWDSVSLTWQCWTQIDFCSGISPVWGVPGQGAPPWWCQSCVTSLHGHLCTVCCTFCNETAFAAHKEKAVGLSSVTLSAVGTSQVLFLKCRSINCHQFYPGLSYCFCYVTHRIQVGLVPPFHCVN